MEEAGESAGERQVRGKISGQANQWPEVAAEVGLRRGNYAPPCMRYMQLSLLEMLRNVDPLDSCQPNIVSSSTLVCSECLLHWNESAGSLSCIAGRDRWRMASNRRTFSATKHREEIHQRCGTIGRGLSLTKLRILAPDRFTAPLNVCVCCKGGCIAAAV